MVHTTRLMLATFAALALSASAANLFPDDGIAQIVRVPRWQLVRLEQEGPMPEGLRASSDRTLDPIWSVESSTPVPFGVKKGDLVAFTAVARGVAASGEAELRVKLQDKTYMGIFNGNVTGDSRWRRRRVFGVAAKDYPAGSLRLHVYPGVKRQVIDVRGWAVENFGPVDPSAMPALAADPQGWPAAELKLPDGPPPPGPIVLPRQARRLRQRTCRRGAVSEGPPGDRVPQEARNTGFARHHLQVARVGQPEVR